MLKHNPFEIETVARDVRFMSKHPHQRIAKLGTPRLLNNKPSFAADKSKAFDLSKGWLLVPVCELATGVSSLAIFRANALSDGPIASVRLKTHDPFAFHGSWHAA